MATAPPRTTSSPRTHPNPSTATQARVKVPTALLPSQPPALPTLPKSLAPLRDEISAALLARRDSIPAISAALGRALDDAGWTAAVRGVIFERLRARGDGGLVSERELVEEVVALVRAGLPLGQRAAGGGKRMGFGFDYEEDEDDTDGQEEGLADAEAALATEEERAAQARRKERIRDYRSRLKIPEQALDKVSEVVKGELEKVCVLVDEYEEHEGEASGE